MKNLFLISMLIITNMILFGCSPSNENETEENHTQSSENEDNSSGNNEDQTEDDKIILDIELPNQKTIHINIEKDIPILQSYLEQFDEPKSEVNRMRSNYLLSNKQRDYFLISYNCGTNLCDQLLLEHNQGDFNTFKVSEASFMQVSKQNNDYLAFLFGRNEGDEVLRNEVVIFNLEDFQKISPPENLAMLESFEYPISSIEWKDGRLITTIAEIDDTSFEALMEWYKNHENPTQKLQWEIQ
ncbi:hypothetical protein [Alkalibacillus aidingensis]|uniref:hypothetical protein n=1 Tax=Alkalibacillus aidingensis TaxID=2747607 RepID=UPI001661388A|nr:hypothetical protein [Alkalibacillus aidingensis]